MEISFALQIAADYYREGMFTAEYAAKRIDEIRELMREHTGCSRDWARATIPPFSVVPGE